MEGPPDIEALYERFSALVLRRVRRFFGAEDKPEDIVQEVFAALGRDPSGLDGALRESSAVYRRATQHCLGRLRKNPSRKSLLATVRGEGSWLEAVGGSDEPLVRRLQRDWRALSPELLEVAVYAEIDGMTVGQIAELIGVERERGLELLADLRKFGSSP
ncbi:hypothetical protein LBMAG42_34840 [Deltaproteobacteria bacterium]|nr:hypothetical protein LBMAG42_34840 [Deltaproteobacteria bacterium]